MLVIINIIYLNVLWLKKLAKKKVNNNSIMKVLVYGTRGWIGGQFVDILNNKGIENYAGNSRVDNDETLKQEIESLKPTHVVSFIGRTHGKIDDKVYTTIDYLEQEGKLVENMRDNLYGPLLLSQICKENGVHFTYLGTGCIFKFDHEHPFGLEENGFTEDSLPNFYGSSYSIVKGYTDRLMKFYNNDVLNLRIRMPITGSYNGRNFITKITTYENVIVLLHITCDRSCTFYVHITNIICKAQSI